MAERRPAGASTERQANFVAAREEHRERQRDERARAAQLRAAGCDEEDEYRPADWDDAHGAWLVPVVELLDVPTPDVLSGRARRHSRAEAVSELRADEELFYGKAQGRGQLFWTRYAARSSAECRRMFRLAQRPWLRSRVLRTSVACSNSAAEP
jgi:hypothetical protein